MDEGSFFLKIKPDLCIPESAVPVLRICVIDEGDKPDIIVRVEMSVKLWKDFFYGATVFCKQVIQSALNGFGLKVDNFHFRYEKQHHYYSYVKTTATFYRSEISPPRFLMEDYCDKKSL